MSLIQKSEEIFSLCKNTHRRFFFFLLRRYNFREVLAFSTSFFHLVGPVSDAVLPVCYYFNDLVYYTAAVYTHMLQTDLFVPAYNYLNISCVYRTCCIFLVSTALAAYPHFHLTNLRLQYLISGCNYNLRSPHAVPCHRPTVPSS